MDHPRTASLWTALAAVALVAAGFIAGRGISLPEAAAQSTSEMAPVYVPVVAKDRGEDLSLFRRRYSGQVQQQDPSRNQTLAKHELCKIPVRGQEQSAHLVGHVQHDVIREPRLHLREVMHLAAVPTKAICNLLVDAFVQKVHVALSPTGYTTSARST